MKTIEELVEFEGGGSVCAYYVKGHEDFDTFLSAVRELCDVTNLREAHHEWWRWVPVGPDYEDGNHMSMWKAKGPGRGAFKVTVVYV